MPFARLPKLPNSKGGRWGGVDKYPERNPISPTGLQLLTAVLGPSLHSLQCSIIPAIEAKAVAVSPPGHDSGPLGGAPSPALA
jgi:hypothetical protein